MRTIKSNYLKDGKLFNDGRPVDLIRIDDDLDFDVLLDNIFRSHYYDLSYFDNHIDYQEGQVKFDSFFLASILRFLKPESILELGCGRGDVLFLLALDNRINVRGIEISREVIKALWPPLEGEVDCGDIIKICQEYDSRKITFDTFCAFDLWEHLLPRKLHDYIDSIITLAEKEALFFFTIPAFGKDRVFGELFPLEFEENREAFQRRRPFDHLIVESLDPPIPALGHLICAHSEWWQKQFEHHGLVRAEELERKIHQYFDEHLFYARRSLYIFRLDSRPARRRINRLMRNNLTLFKKWKILVQQQEIMRRFEEREERSFIDLDELKSTINHAEVFMMADAKNQIERWTWKTLRQKKKGRWVEPFLARSEKWAQGVLDNYIRSFKKRHYRV